VFIPPRRSYAAFIFDCDGTLADSMPLHHEAWARALRKHGAGLDFTWELLMRRAGMTLERTVEELNAEFGLGLVPAEVAAEQRRVYEELMRDVRPIAPVVDFARRAARTVPVSVASGGEAGIVRRTLSTIGVADLFAVVVTSDEVERGKPHPDLFLLAAERMGVAAEACCVFEDSQLGMQAAERAKMGAVLVGRTPQSST
jgi:beta-phosphoglucomutase-like phosphatase (HAD superfamily)